MNDAPRTHQIDPASRFITGTLRTLCGRPVEKVKIDNYDPTCRACRGLTGYVNTADGSYLPNRRRQSRRA